MRYEHEKTAYSVVCGDPATRGSLRLGLRYGRNTSCRRIGPAVDALAAEYAGKVAVGKVNVDEQPELAEQF